METVSDLCDLTQKISDDLINKNETQENNESIQPSDIEKIHKVDCDIRDSLAEEPRLVLGSNFRRLARQNLVKCLKRKEYDRLVYKLQLEKYNK